MDYNDIKIEERKGMTVTPDIIDEVTGQRIEGTAQVHDFEHKHPFFRDEQQAQVQDQLEPNDPAIDPELQEPPIEIRLADTFDDINTAEFDVSPEFANEIAGADIGDSPEAITVKYLATQVYSGNITAEEAFNAAVESGYEPDNLMFAYYNLKNYFNQ